jgi:hypothetical protein
MGIRRAFRSFITATAVAIMASIALPVPGASAVSFCSSSVSVYVGLESQDHINAGSTVSAYFFSNRQLTTPLACTINSPRFAWSYSSSSELTSGVLTTPTVIIGQTGSSFTPAEGSIYENKFIQLTLSYKTGSTNQWSYSSPIEVWPVTAAPPVLDPVTPITYTVTGNVLHVAGNVVQGTPAPTESYRWWSCTDNSDETFGSLPPDAGSTTYVNGAGETICNIVPGATSATYTVAGNEFGPYFFPEVFEVNDYGQESGFGQLLPSVNGAALTGHAWEGSSLNATYTSIAATYPASTITYQYQISSDSGSTWNSVTGSTASATSSHYTLTANDRNATSPMLIRALIIQTFGAQVDTGISTSMPTLTYPVANGGNILTADKGLYSPGTYETGQTVIGHPWNVVGTPWPTLHYQWYLCTTQLFSSCSAATSEGNQGNSTHLGGSSPADLGNYDFSFVIPAAASGKYVTWGAILSNTATDKSTKNSFTKNSIQNSGVVIGGAAISGTPDISGIPSVGHELTAATVTYASSPVGKISYKWGISSSASGPFTPISGAVQSSYIPVAGDLGNYLQVTATATNSVGHTATSVSATPVLVAPAYLAPSGALLSLGESPSTSLGETLTTSVVAPTSGYPNSYSYTYSWSRCLTAGTGCQLIAGATGSSYVTSTSDLGKYVTATAKVANAAGSQTVSSSNFAGPVSGTIVAPTFDTPVAIVGGYTVNITNYLPGFTYTPSSSAGSVALGNPVGSILPLRVTGLNASTSADVHVSVSHVNYSSANGSTTGTSMAPVYTVTSNISGVLGGQSGTFNHYFYIIDNNWSNLYTGTVGKPLTINVPRGSELKILLPGVAYTAASPSTKYNAALSHGSYIWAGGVLVPATGYLDPTYGYGYFEMLNITPASDITVAVSKK